MVESLAKVATDLVKHPIKTPKSLASDEAQAEAFASLKSEVDRQGGVQISEPDWELVEKLSIDYLRRVQKDLRAASYLARAWSEQHGANGALAGAQLLEQLLATGADKIAPPRVRGRQQALQWWSRQTLVNSCDGLGNTENAEQQKAFLECLDRMSATIESDPKLAGKKELFLDVREELNTDPAELAAYEGMPAEAATAKDAASSSPDKSEPEAPPLVTTYTDDSGADTPADTSPLDADVQDKQSAIDDPTLLKWVAEVQTPVSAESPTGDDLHLSDEFEYLKDQVNNTLRVREVDWQQVFDQSLDYLRLSKDLRVMAYCVFAMVENDGCRGLFRGLVLLSRFLDDFGAECHPHRARARERALRWLAVQTDERLKRHDMTGVSLTELERCARQVDAINDALAEREELLIGGPALAKIGLLVRGEIESKEV
jgi:predicted component of type VI protein secretion system